MGLTQSSNNTLLVADPGSVLSYGSRGNVIIGNNGYGNSMVISNGGAVFDRDGRVASGPGPSSGNSAQVVGTGSVWSNSDQMTIQGLSNSLVIGNGGKVFDTSGGAGSSGSSNSVQVISNGLWQNGTLTVGGSGSGNSLTINGGAISATSLAIGPGSPTCDNLVELDSGSLTVTNNGNGVVQVSGGRLILSGGVLQVDTLQFTGSCASFVHTGGTLIAGSVVLDPNTFRIVSVTPQGNDMLVTWMMGPGATNTLQVTSGDGNGNYVTNGFTDVFIVTNNTAVGTVTNYLDIGAATNKPSRFYRARLVP
jgi:hypothetical protein